MLDIEDDLPSGVRESFSGNLEEYVLLQKQVALSEKHEPRDQPKDYVAPYSCAINIYWLKTKSQEETVCIGLAVLNRPSEGFKIQKPLAHGYLYLKDGDIIQSGAFANEVKRMVPQIEEAVRGGLPDGEVFKLQPFLAKFANSPTTGIKAIIPPTEK